MRLFFALWPPHQTALALAAWARRVKHDLGAGGVSGPAANLHLTLAFLGEVEEARLPELRSFPVWGEHHALVLDEVGYWARNSLLWAGARETPRPLVDLAGRLHDLLSAREFRTESRPFAAHVTLLRKAKALEEWPALPGELDWPVEECVLARSVRTRQGPVYEILQRYPLQ